MKIRHWMWSGVVLLAVVALAAGPAFWVYAQNAHEDGGGHMMHGEHHAHKKDKGHHGSRMPMMHADMSAKEMDQYCSRMQNRHETMREKRQKQTERLNSLVESMKTASGEAKIEAMQETLVELVNQHQKRSKKMMRSMHSMMGSMMGLHRMDRKQRRRMMDRMGECPMMQHMMGSEQDHGSSMGSSSR